MDALTRAWEVGSTSDSVDCKHEVFAETVIWRQNAIRGHLVVQDDQKLVGMCCSVRDCLLKDSRATGQDTSSIRMAGWLYYIHLLIRTG